MNKPEGVATETECDDIGTSTGRNTFIELIHMMMITVITIVVVVVSLSSLLLS